MINIELPYNSVIPFLGIYPKGGKKKTNTKNICTPMFIATLLTITKTQKQTMFLGGRFRREGTYTYLRLIHTAIWQKPIQHCKTNILQLKMKKKKKNN